MGSNMQNPMFFILNANPGRYINTKAAAIVALVRAAEAVIALMLVFRVGRYLMGLIDGTSPGVLALPGLLSPGGDTGLLPPAMQTVLEDQLADIMPEGQTLETLLQQTLGDPEEGMQALMTPGSIETIVTGLAAAALLAILAAVVVEGVALIMLRFAMKGAKAAKIAHKAIFIASIVLLLAGICLTLIFINKCRMLGLTMSVLLMGEMKTTFILIALCLVILFLRVLYHRDVAKVLAAIDYEIRIGFKETTMRVKRLSGSALLFAALALAAVVYFFFKTGPLSTGVLIAAVLVIKYIMVYSSYDDFKQSHT